ncbi:MAG: MCE family protein [Actinobacteria bacterium]|nr:MCE family protein [Actinomycetota bacterium]
MRPIGGTVVRRLAGVLAAVALVVGGVALLGVVAAPPSGSYDVTVHLGRSAGKGLDPGSDVKVRGVLVGSISDVRLDENGNAVAVATIRPIHRLPREVTPAVTSKTFLGEKQLELRPRRERLNAGPPLSGGDVLRVADDDAPTEVQDFLASLEPVLDAIDPVELGMVVDTLGDFDRTDAEIAARNIEVGAELADFGARTAPEQLARLSALATLAAELATTAEDFNRLNRSLPAWVGVLPDRQPAVRRNLETLSSFSQVTRDFLQVQQDAIREVLAVTTTVNRVIAGQADGLSQMIFGIYRYSLKLASHGGSLSDHSEHGWFRGLIGGEGELEELCGRLPGEFQRRAPGCVARAPAGGGRP